MNEPNYYRIKFNGLPYEVYEYGTDAIEAVAIARNDLNEGQPLGNATARRAVYKEWNYGTERFTNGGDFLK